MARSSRKPRLAVRLASAAAVLVVEFGLLVLGVYVIWVAKMNPMVETKHFMAVLTLIVMFMALATVLVPSWVQRKMK